jgi:hypothetical protein
MPTAARMARSMIWMTAKSTEVSSFQIPRPRRANGFVGAGEVLAAPTTVDVAMSGS